MRMHGEDPQRCSHKECEGKVKEFRGKLKLSLHMRTAHVKVRCGHGQCSFEGSPKTVKVHRYTKHHIGAKAGTQLPPSGMYEQYYCCLH